MIPALEIDALNKEPGVYSARYMGEDTSYDIKNQNLIDRLDGVPKEKCTARFVCAIAAVLPDGKELVTRQTMEGYIGWEPEGANGFGYDPIFYLDEFGCFFRNHFSRTEKCNQPQRKSFACDERAFDRAGKK